MKITKELEQIQIKNAEKKERLCNKYGKLIKKREYNLMSIQEQILYNRKEHSNL